MPEGVLSSLDLPPPHSVSSAPRAPHQDPESVDPPWRQSIIVKTAKFNMAIYIRSYKTERRKLMDEEGKMKEGSA